MRSFYGFKSPRDYNLIRKPSDIQGVSFFMTVSGTIKGSILAALIVQNSCPGVENQFNFP